MGYWVGISKVYDTINMDWEERPIVLALIQASTVAQVLCGLCERIGRAKVP